MSELGPFLNHLVLGQPAFGPEQQFHGTLTMTRRTSFSQRDAIRLARAAIAAGLAVYRMETKDGKVIVVTSGERSTTAMDELDRELAAFEAQHGKD
jgi:hypothetical protein